MQVKLLPLVFFLMVTTSTVLAQQVVPLYESTIPGALNVKSEETYDTARSLAFKVYQPTLTAYLPAKEKATGAAVIVCPGGGYGVLVIGKEGFDIAKYYAAHGVAAFVLKYRLPDSRIMKDKSIGPLQDAQRAIQLVRQHAAQWNVDPAKIGIMGFSAGGHLASTAGTHYSEALIPNTQNTSLRPDFMLLVYPVISMTDSLGHKGSRENLLGKNADAKKIQLFSNDQQVNVQTPPAFLIHAGDDKVVDVDNSISFYEALRHNKVPAEMHIYPKGDHGFVLNLPIDQWMSICLQWMSNSGIIPSK